MLATVEVPTSGNFGLGDNRSRTLENQGLAMFSETIPLPMKMPGDNYEVSNEKPWFFQKG